MSPEALFLTAFAQVISAMTLYEDGHPGRERAIDNAFRRLADLQAQAPRRNFTFLDTELLVDGRPLRELRSWDWGTRLAKVGIQRLEFLGEVSRDDLEAFLDEAFGRLTGAEIGSAEVRQGRPSNIRYGEVALRGQGEGGTGAEKIVTATMGYSLKEEIEGLEWLQGELKDQRELHLLEAEMIVRSLSVAMHGDQAFLIPLVRLKEYDQYTVTHTLNVSVLTMALAEFLGLSPREVRAFGIAGLLHDLGKVKIPDEILNKPGKLTDAERKVMNDHTVEGARMIIEAEEHLDMAAVVAYEHHIRIDGGGYPSLRFERACHQASNLVHVCDVFDALRTNRPYREAWPTERALGIIEEGAGPEFDKEIATAFVQMMRRWEGRVASVSHDDPEIRYGENGAGDDAGRTEVPESGAGGTSEPPPASDSDDDIVWEEGG